MKIHLEQLDLLRPWPEFVVPKGYNGLRVLVRLGAIPVGQIALRPPRPHVGRQRLRRRIARDLGDYLLKILLDEGLRAGPEAMAEYRGRCGKATLRDGMERRRFVERAILDPAGLPAPFRHWITAAAGADRFALPPLTVAICTRDRASMLRGCLEALKAQDYPEYEILVVDNSVDPVPTAQLAAEMRVHYLRAEEPGKSCAMNLLLAHALTRWIALTDDDCRPEPNWLRELVRPLSDERCRCVTGLVVPAQLQSDAEVVFEMYGGLGRGYLPVVFGYDYYAASRSRPPATWMMGAGANMLIDGPLVRELGGYDEDMGAGCLAGTGEDIDIFYKLLRAGHIVRYAPRALVHHLHRCTAAQLRRQLFGYSRGHTAYHWRCLWRYGDLRSAAYLAWWLPKSLRWRWQQIRLKRSRYPVGLLLTEVRGMLEGPLVYTGAKLARLARSVFRAVRGRRGVVATLPAGTPAEAIVSDDFDTDIHPPRPVRAA